MSPVYTFAQRNEDDPRLYVLSTPGSTLPPGVILSLSVSLPPVSLVLKAIAP